MVNHGRKWVVRDRYDNEIYMTQERWRHALRFHPELIGHLEDVLDTLRTGRRRQKPLRPNEYKYYNPCDALPLEYNCIVVVVAFTERQLPDGTFGPNNFVKTAWGIYLYRLER
ncbi:MAG: hypothetical protein U9Q78_03365 [Chloroflexota bacterium]|nr:hypothetical protein [Chloroflexota bacterium]